MIQPRNQKLNPCGQLECDCKDCWEKFCKDVHYRFDALCKDRGFLDQPLELDVYGQPDPKPSKKIEETVTSHDSR